ncbi:Na/Pi cotransporter family protein [Bacteroidota bacterium]
MKFGLFELLTLLGSLGLFLFGMKMLSEGLQKVAGDKLRKILSAMTSNRLKGVLTGFLITGIIQSSSATTVMIVSFVNAGLLSLIESIGVIMGANIGTTVTAWIISILGFKINISLLSLPLIGFGFPFVFSRHSKRKSWGELLIGFAILFMGLEFLKNSVPDISSNPEILSFLSNYTDMGLLSILLFLGIGTILTVLIQSSSAVMALTLVMCNSGWISFDIAAAMVLGENIGTTITANLAATVANVSAKRAAGAHLIFNVVGVIWILLVFPPFLKLINGFIISAGGSSPYESAAAIPVALSIFHSSFNIINVILLIGFSSLISKIVIKIIPSKVEDEEFHLKHIKTGMVSTSELSILQAKEEIAVYGRRTKKMFGLVCCQLMESNDKKFHINSERINKYEINSDKIEVEIATYLTKLAEGELGKLGIHRIRTMLKLIDDIESVSDSCFNICKAFNRKKEQKAWFPPEVRENLNIMFAKVNKSLDIMCKNLEMDYSRVTIQAAKAAEKDINEYRNALKHEHLSNVEKKSYKYQAGVIYNDIFSDCEKLADYVINVTEAIVEENNN